MLAGRASIATAATRQARSLPLALVRSQRADVQAHALVVDRREPGVLHPAGRDPVLRPAQQRVDRVQAGELRAQTIDPLEAMAVAPPRAEVRGSGDG